MKKITLLLLLLTVTFSVRAQFPEGFETTVPPTGWVTFIGTNGEGTGYDWTESTTAATGSKAAFVRYESVANSAEDWLVTPQFTPSAAGNILTFKQRQSYGTDYGNVYTIRVSTASQNTHADFTIVDTQSESDFGLVYSTHNVDLSAYNGVPIYVAFVMENDDGDNWYVDDVDLIPNATAPNCATNPTPADMATGVTVTGGNVTIAWTAPATGDPATGYEVFWGETSGNLSSLGTLSATTVDITNVNLSTTYYWMIVPQNVGGSATGCAEWSFTTEDPPPPPPNDTLAGAIPITPSAAGTGCGSAGFTLNFSSDGTTDSGMDGTCNTTDTGLDQFFTWTATTDALLFNDTTPGNPGIIIRDAGGTEIDCAGTFASTDLILSGWNIGDDLIIQIYDYATTGAAVDVAFCLEEYTLPNPPANDDCGGASSLTVNSDLSCTAVTSGTIEGATDSGEGDNGVGTPNDDVWYTFVATEASHQFSMLNVAGSYTDLVHEVLDGSCGSLTSLNVSDGNTSTVSGFTPGNTYYVRVFGYSSTAGRNTTFDVCVGTLPPPPGNDAPAGALALTLDDSAACGGNTITGISNAGTTDSGEAAPACGSYSGGDLWYTFVAGASTITLNTSNVTGLTSVAGAYYSGSVGSLTEEDCTEFGSGWPWELTGLTQGQTYYLRVWDYGNDQTGTFDLCGYYDGSTASIGDDEIEGFSLFPTIVKDNLTITSQDIVDTITIYNLMGQQVFTRKLNLTNTTVDLTALSSGMYIVKAKVGAKVGTYKIIKE
ncbi:MAG: T9SS type A sorting domain-containing protein [Flavobacteriaceae bacterium]